MEPQSILGISDPISCLSHFAGAIVAASAGVQLLRRSAPDRSRMACVFVFVASSVFLLTMSGLYHFFEHGTEIRAFVRRLDILGIFFLIAGTFTPIIGILYQGRSRLILMIAIWGLTLVAIIYRFAFSTNMGHWQGFLIFLGIGWTGLIPALQTGRRYGIDFVLPLYLGALAYTFGGIAQACGVPVLIPGVFGPHEQFHFAVLIGLSMHWTFIYSFADGSPRTWRFGRQHGGLKLHLGGTEKRAVA